MMEKIISVDGFEEEVIEWESVCWMYYIGVFVSERNGRYYLKWIV